MHYSIGTAWLPPAGGLTMGRVLGDTRRRPALPDRPPPVVPRGWRGLRSVLGGCTGAGLAAEAPASEVVVLAGRGVAFGEGRGERVPDQAANRGSVSPAAATPAALGATGPLAVPLATPLVASGPPGTTAEPSATP
mmetsp:Transcript_65247/g.113752  ORF Transcript_65247/g.113752 Transcript_65247/m.113752 type:complete len:136 (+) Transcript_65247:3-410(+)